MEAQLGGESLFSGPKNFHEGETPEERARGWGGGDEGGGEGGGGE